MFGGRVHELEDHREASGAAEPRSYGCEPEFNGVCRSQMRPVLGEEALEGEQLRAIFLQVFDRPGIISPVVLKEGVEGCRGVLGSGRDASTSE